MQESKQIIELSEHVKNKIKSHRITPLSFSSDEFNLSENGNVEIKFSLKRKYSFK
jgi:hypothetical protein